MVRSVTSGRVARETEYGGRAGSDSAILRAVHVVTREAGHAALVHRLCTKSLPCIRFLCAVPSRSE